MQTNCANALCHLNAMPLSVAVLVGKASTAKMGQCLGGGRLSLSLSLSLVSQLFICVLFFQFFKSLCSFFFAFKAKIHKFYSFLRLATLALLVRNDGSFCHFEPFAKRRPSGLQGASRSKKSTFRIQCSALRVLCGYFANAQYDKVYQYDNLIFLRLRA